jgi:hypothetical protein
VVDSSVSSVLKVAMGLSPSQRADLAATLLAGIDDGPGGPPVSGTSPMVERLWALEVDYRIDDAHDRGELDPPWEQLRGTPAVPDRQVRVVPRAEAELRAVFDLYLRSRPLLFAILLESLEEAVARIRHEADALPRVPMTDPLRRVRRASVHGFPMQLLFHDDHTGDARLLALVRIGRAPAT